MTRKVYKSRLVLAYPSAAISRWVQEVQLFGRYAQGVIFCDNHQDIGLYMKLIEDGGTVPNFVRTRTFHGTVEYLFDNRAKLTVHMIKSSSDVTAISGEQWSFMVFHNPGLWVDRGPMRLLLPRLIPNYDGGTTLISVGTPVSHPLATDEPPDPAPPAIDWLEINRQFSGR